MHDPRRHEPTDEHLGESLRRLPDARAGEGFTRAVLARLEAPEAAEAASRRRPGTGGRPAWLPVPTPRLAAVLATAVVVGLVGAPLLLNGPAGPAPERAVEPTAQDPLLAQSPDHREPSDRAGAGATDTDTGFGTQPDTAPTTAPPTARSSRPAAGPEGHTGADAPAGERLAAVDLPPPAGPPPATGPAGEPAPDTPPQAGSRPGRGEGSGPANGPEPSGGSARERTVPAPPALPPRGDVRRAGTGSGSAPEELDRQAMLHRLTELRQRQERLRADLAALSATSQPGRAPTLLLGGDENVELVLDLNAPRPADLGHARPAVHRPEPERYRNGVRY